VVASVVGNDRGVEPGVDKGEVVGTHLGETIGVLVDERCLEDGVSRTGGGEVGNKTGGDWRVRHVVRPLRSPGTIADGEEENLDGVGETDIVGWLGIGLGSESLTGSGLDLLDENITGSTGHTLTFVIGDNSVVSPDLGDTEDGGDGNVSGYNEVGTLFTYSSNVLEDKKVLPVAEREVDTHLIVWESGSGEGNTGITAVEEGEGKIESGGGKGIASTGGVGLSKGSNVTNHIVVAIALASWDGEGGPEVKVVIVKTSSNKVIESDAALTNDIVH